MILDNSITSPKRRRPRRSSFISQARRWVQVDRQTSLKLVAATKGDMQQLNWFCETCKGITQNPPMFLQTSQATTTTSSAMNDMSRDGDGSGMCVICMDDASTEEAVCVPCGHVAGCVSCLKDIKDNNLGCPVCRANIDQVIKLYHV